MAEKRKSRSILLPEVPQGSLSIINSNPAKHGTNQ